MIDTPLPKRERTRLLKAEIWMGLAVTAQRWSNEVAGRDPRVLPIEQWGSDDFFLGLCRTYGVTPVELAHIIEQVAQQVETRSMQAGYEHTLNTD